MHEHLIWLLLAAFIVGLSKGGLSSSGSLAVPMLALFMNPVVAAAFLLPIFIVTDWFAVWLLVMTGGVGFWYVMRSWFGSGRNAPATEAKIVPGILWGIVTGITTFITHSGAPPSQAYLLPQKLPRLVFAGTMAITFAIGNAAKIPGYWALGYFDNLDWTLIALLTCVGIAGTAAGRQIVKFLTDSTYVRVIEVLLLILSIVLFWKAFTLVTAG